MPFIKCCYSRLLCKIHYYQVFAEWEKIYILNSNLPLTTSHSIKHVQINTRGQISTIDFVIANRSFHPSQILDIRSLTSGNVRTDHLHVQNKTINPKEEEIITRIHRKLKHLSQTTQQNTFTGNNFDKKSEVSQQTKMTSQRKLGKSWGQIS